MRVELTQADLERCNEFGRMVVAGYAAGKKDQSKALFVPGKPTIHDKWEPQADGRLAELAFVRAAGFTDEHLNWSDQSEKGILKGTRYMDEDELSDIHDLFHIANIVAAKE